MSINIPTAFARAYHANLNLQFQQMTSKLRGTTMERTFTGDMDFWDYVQPTAAVKRTTRHADTLRVDMGHERRACGMSDYEWADLIDKQDRLRLLADPNSSYVTSARAALNRAMDQVIIAAMYADVTSGQTGTGTTTFATDYPGGTRDATHGDPDVSAAAMDLDDLILFKEMLDENDVPDDGRHILVSPHGLGQFLTTTEVGSADYNTVKTLVQGSVNTFMGFTWHELPTSYFPLAAATDYYGFVWHESALGLSIGEEIMTDVSIRYDKSLAAQVYASLSLAAVRTQGGGVIRYRFDNSL